MPDHRNVTPDDATKLRALRADGHTQQVIAELTGWSLHTIQRHTTHGAARPTYRAAQTAERTAETRKLSSETQLRTQNEVDPIAVERILAGNPPERATRGERQAAVHKLTAQGWTANRIAQRTRMSERTVQRLQARNRT